MSDLITICVAGALAILGGVYSRTPKKNECIKSYATCITQLTDDKECDKIMYLCGMEKDLLKVKAKIKIQEEKEQEDDVRSAD